MNDTKSRDRSIDSLLAETGFTDDAMLRNVLIEARAEAMAVRPLPGPAVARLLAPALRRSRHHRRYVVALVVGATVLGGGAAAASPLLGDPGVATAIIAGLFGSPGAGVPGPAPSASAHAAPNADLTHSSHSPAAVPSAGSSSHPTSNPGVPKALQVPKPTETHPAPPIPLPTPQSTHASDHSQP
jgi:hypothetical protein